MTSESIKDITISDFMTKEVKTISENETLKEASKLMYEKNIGSVVIRKATSAGESVASNNKQNQAPLGILTERDIARMVGFSSKFAADTNVTEVMSKQLKTVSPNAHLKDAIALMNQENIRRLPVVDYKGDMVGIITAKDILKIIMKLFMENEKGRELKSEGFDLLGLLGAE
jgi:CBS domain-containing protein